MNACKSSSAKRLVQCWLIAESKGWKTVKKVQNSLSLAGEMFANKGPAIYPHKSTTICSYKGPTIYSYKDPAIYSSKAITVWSYKDITICSYKGLTLYYYKVPTICSYKGPNVFPTKSQLSVSTKEKRYAKTQKAIS